MATNRLVSLVGDCDVCGKISVGHEYTEVGTVISPSSSCDSFEECSLSEMWQDVANFQEFEGTEDTLCLSAIRSHKHQEIVVVLWVSAAALYGRDLFINKKVVHGMSAELLADTLYSNKWISMPTKSN